MRTRDNAVVERTEWWRRRRAQEHDGAERRPATVERFWRREEALCVVLFVCEVCSVSFAFLGVREEEA